MSDAPMTPGCPFTEWVVSQHPDCWYIYAICDAGVVRMRIANGARFQLNFPAALAEGLSNVQAAINDFHAEYAAADAPPPPRDLLN